MPYRMTPGPALELERGFDQFAAHAAPARRVVVDRALARRARYLGLAVWRKEVKSPACVGFIDPKTKKVYLQSTPK